MKNLFLLDPQVTFLNHGSYGACPKKVFENYQEWQKKLEFQPVQFFTTDLWEYLKLSRKTLGNYINCKENDLLLFPNPTTAVNNIINNLDLRKGDEVLMTQHEYGALKRAWRDYSKKKNFTVIEQKTVMPVDKKKDFVNQFWSGVTKNTKVIFISHITSETALIFPVKKICELARKSGIITIVDGAHVPGHIELDIAKLDCDYYAGACHKWLCAPKGVSFLYVKKNIQENMMPQVVSWGEEGEDPGPTKFLKNFQWQGTKDMSAFLSLPAAVDFVKNKKWVKQQKICKDIISQFSKQIHSLFNKKPIFKGDGWIGQMVSCPLPSGMPENLKKILWKDYLIEVPIFNWQGKRFIRISYQCYNSQNDLDKLIYALNKLMI